MARPKSKQPTDRELEILHVLWETGPTGLGHIRRSLEKHRPAVTTTVATMLNVMLDKGLVKRTEGPRGYLWSARLSRKKTTSGMLRKLLDGAFEGSATRLVAHLIEEERLSQSDRQEIQRMLSEASKRKNP